MSYTLNDFQNALINVRKVIPPTPLKYSKWLSELTEKNVYLKLEIVNPGNSFKIRGASNFIYSYLAQNNTMPEKIISASGGNHGLAVAIIAQQFNIPCKIVLPANSSEHRIKLLESYNADVELHGKVWDEANIYAKNLVNAKSVYIHPFSHEWVIHGQGTIGLEIYEQLPSVNAVIGSIGGGGMMAGTATSLKLSSQFITTYGVETVGADYYYQSLQAQKLIELNGITSIAKSLGAKTGTQNVYKLLTKYVDYAYTVTDQEAVVMMQEVLEHERILIEPATSCSVATLLRENIPGENIVIIICGANSTYSEFINWKKQFTV